MDIRAITITAVLAAAALTPVAPAAAEPVSSYLVVLDHARVSGADAQTLTQRVGGHLDRVYTTALSGFSARLSQSQASTLAKDPAVAYVVPDLPVHALGQQPNPPSWGLDRIDQRTLPLDQLYRFATGADNVNAYVLDTGVRATHQDVAGRVSGGVDIVDNDGNPDDGNGHGTFIAGIIGGTRFGVAKKVHIVPVRVLDDSGAGSMANVIAGIDWITRNARKPAVVNMSLGGAANQALDDAVRASIASGVTYVVASGSSSSDAGNFSPARVPEAITTSATRIDDCVFPPSNFGPLIDLYAPGANVTSIWITSDTATITLSGTSWSTAYTAGGAALFLSTNPAARPAAVEGFLVNRATRGVLCNVPPNTPNRLLYTGP